MSTVSVTLYDVVFEVEYYVDETERGPFIVVESAHIGDEKNGRVEIYSLLDWGIQQEIQGACKDNEISQEEQYHERQYDQRKEDGYL